jgi:DNA invertase Pin-like site-specific DNA recombinase
MNTAIYTRTANVSPESHDAQRKSCEALAEKLGYTVVAHYEDSCPGDSLDRPGFTKLRIRAVEKKFDNVIVHAADRLSNDPVMVAFAFTDLNSRGVSIKVVTEPSSGDSDVDKVVRFVLGWAGQIESVRFKERMRRGKEAKKLQAIAYVRENG